MLFFNPCHTFIYQNSHIKYNYNPILIYTFRSFCYIMPCRTFVLSTIVSFRLVSFCLVLRVLFFLFPFIFLYKRNNLRTICRRRHRHFFFCSSLRSYRIGFFSRLLASSCSIPTNPKDFVWWFVFFSSMKMHLYIEHPVIISSTSNF